MTHPARLIVDNPFTLETACTVELAGDAKVDQVLDQAALVVPEASELPVRDRVALVLSATDAMVRRADDIAADISAMMGKPWKQARSEVDGMALRARYMASIAESALADVVPREEAGFERRIVKAPLGVVL